MGKHALRKQVAQKLKAAGLGTKLYKGNKKVAWRFLRPHYLRELLWKLDFVTPGQLVHDCYGANFHIKGLTSSPKWRVGDRGWSLFRRGRLVVACIEQVEYVEGLLSCGCNASPEPPLTREQIEQSILSWVTDSSMEQWDYHRADWRKQVLAALQRGEHVLDEEGVYLPEYAWYKSV